MKGIQDETKLSTISMPGTHNTMTSHDVDGIFSGCKGRFGRRLCLTQTWKLDEQLKNGIRFIDIRIYQSNRSPGTSLPLQLDLPYPNITTGFGIYHHLAYLDVTLNDVLDILRTFLSSQRTETVSKSLDLR